MLKIAAIATDKCGRGPREPLSSYARRQTACDGAADNLKEWGMHAQQTASRSDTDTGPDTSPAYPSAIGPLLPGTQSPVLAQLPDLETDRDDAATAPSSAGHARSDGRIISQGLSNKLVVGGGILLVLAAVVPFTLNRKTVPKPVDAVAPLWQPSPAPVTGDASPNGVSGLAKTPGPRAVTPNPAEAGSLSSVAKAYEAARPNPGHQRSYLQPQASTNRPMAIGDPPWPGPAVAEPHGPTPPQPEYRPAEPSNQLPVLRGEYGAARPEGYRSEDRLGRDATIRPTSATRFAATTLATRSKTIGRTRRITGSHREATSGRALGKITATIAAMRVATIVAATRGPAVRKAAP